MPNDSGSMKCSAPKVPTRSSRVWQSQSAVSVCPLSDRTTPPTSASTSLGGSGGLLSDVERPVFAFQLIRAFESFATIDPGTVSPNTALGADWRDNRTLHGNVSCPD